MKQAEATYTDGWGQRLQSDQAPLPAARLVSLVDASLCGILCFAPFIFGGRHDLGRLVLVSLIAIAASSWFARQAIIAHGGWHRSVAHVILLLAIGLLTLQIVPLPASWIPRLAPRTAELLPMWTGDGEGAVADSNAQFALGPWRTLSLMPHETVKSLAMLVAYALLFVVVAQRIDAAADVRRLLRWIAISGVLMATFGLLQYFTSDGRFFWFFDHPFRTTSEYVTGSFTNRNHFAGFLVLAVGPLVAWVVHVVRPATTGASRRTRKPTTRERVLAIALTAALALVILAILRSLSRGGAVALLVATAAVAGIYWYRRLVDARYAYGLVFLALAMIGLLSIYGYDDVARRLDDFAEGTIDAMDHEDARRKIWGANVAAIEAGWLTGSGAGSHRAIYPVYLHESHATEYTHAENGYLQVATETGVFGVALLLSGIALCAGWCVTCFRRLGAPAEILCFGACAAGLAASVVHSAFDFVWYIPACMSVTVVLAACTLRLAQLYCAETSATWRSSSDSEPPASEARTERLRRVPQASPLLPAATNAGEASGRSAQPTTPPVKFVLARGRWCELAVAVALVGVWTIHTYIGPALAAIHWDRYLRASVADHALSRQLLSEFVSGEAVSAYAMRRKLSETMLDELRQAASWDPQSAAAHLRLADRLMSCFELEIVNAENVMDVTQIREAAFASPFASTLELNAWLQRAFGPAAAYLDEALFHARRAVELCPLCGEGYLYLADLCFLEGASRIAVRAYVDQGLAVRPYAKDVLFRAGRQELFLDPAAAIDHWSKCFNMPGPHQQEIVYRLISSHMPAAEFAAHFQADWHSLREIWAQYRARGTAADLEALVEYAANVTTRQISDRRTIRPEHIWFWQAAMYRDLNRGAEALACLEQSHACDPRQFHVRSALARSLIEAGRFAEAEPHVRWCLARKPTERSLANALATISKQRFAGRANAPSQTAPTAISAAPVVQAAYEEHSAR